MNSYESKVLLTSFNVTTSQVIYPWTKLGERYSGVFFGAFADNAVDGLTIFLDFSRDGVTPISRLRVTLSVAALDCDAERIEDFRPPWVRVSAFSNKAGFASVAGRYWLDARPTWQ